MDFVLFRVLFACALFLIDKAIAYSISSCDTTRDRIA